MLDIPQWDKDRGTFRTETLNPENGVRTVVEKNLRYGHQIRTDIVGNRDLIRSIADRPISNGRELIIRDQNRRQEVNISTEGKIRKFYAWSSITSNSLYITQNLQANETGAVDSFSINISEQLHLDEGETVDDRIHRRSISENLTDLVSIYQQIGQRVFHPAVEDDEEYAVMKQCAKDITESDLSYSGWSEEDQTSVLEKLRLLIAPLAPQFGSEITDEEIFNFSENLSHEALRSIVRDKNPQELPLKDYLDAIVNAVGWTLHSYYTFLEAGSNHDIAFRVTDDGIIATRYEFILSEDQQQIEAQDGIYYVNEYRFTVEEHDQMYVVRFWSNYGKDDIHEMTFNRRVDVESIYQRISSENVDDWSSVVNNPPQSMKLGTENITLDE